MPLTLSLRFPTGRYAAAAWEDRERPEWPPHPARLALALIDVLHKAGNSASLRAALSWLCHQPAPWIVVPEDKHIDVQQMEGFFVPQNPSQADGFKHPRKSRSFPSVFLDPEHPTVFFHWPDALPDDTILSGLTELATRLPRFGHSSSLVIAQVTQDAPPSNIGWRKLLPASDAISTAEYKLRVPYVRLLEAAEAAFAAESRATEMAALIGKAAKAAKPDKTLKPAASPRGRHDPRHQWQGYIEELSSAVPMTPWDHRVMLLARVGDPQPGLVSTWQTIELLHKTLLDRWSRDTDRGPVPPWISGHQPGKGKTAPARDNHLAFFPIADIQHPHAQGRLMGIGLAFPRPETAGIDPIALRLDWQKAMACLFPKGAPLELAISSGETRLILQPANPDESRKAFQLSRWIGPATRWSTVTPVVFDRHPKPDFKKDPVAWKRSCRKIILGACQRIGLPEPVHIDVSPYSEINGVPRSSAFTPPPARPGRPVRIHLHVTLSFADKVVGPVLLGAGRFRGYGLLAPLV